MRVKLSLFVIIFMWVGMVVPLTSVNASGAPCDYEQVCITVPSEAETELTEDWTVIDATTALDRVRIVFRDSVAVARLVTFDLKNEIATLEGQVLVERADSRTEAEKLVLMLADEHYTFTGNVTMREFADDGAETRVLSAQLLTYDEASGHAHLEHDVRIRDSERFVQADDAEYFKNEDRLVLTGNGILEQEDVSLREFTKLEIDLKTNVARIPGAYIATFKLREGNTAEAE